MAPPRIALTPGEPAGIGPDLCVMLAQTGHTAELVALCDPALLTERAERLGLSLRLLPFDATRPPSEQLPGSLRVDAGSGSNQHPSPNADARAGARLSAAVIPGRLDPANAAYVLQTLRRACDGCLDGHFDAMVTAPVHKGVINDAGLAFTGHTEFLAERCNANPVMMLTAPGLRVALVTTHLPLRAVADALTAERLTRVIETLERELRTRFGLQRPRILVCGLNPHAGEGGYLGREEIDIIIPVLERLKSDGAVSYGHGAAPPRKMKRLLHRKAESGAETCAAIGFDLRGPLPADTAFVPEQIARVDVVLAMYHDQGLPVLKHLGFGRAVNVTLGLPIIRTSVDHGTALDLAGSGQAHVGSLEAALDLAITMATHARAADRR